MYDEDVIDRFGFEPPGSAHRPTLDIHLLKRLIAPWEGRLVTLSTANAISDRNQRRASIQN